MELLVGADPEPTTAANDPICTGAYNMADCYRAYKMYDIKSQGVWSDYFYADKTLTDWGVPLPAFWNFQNMTKYEYWSNLLDYKPLQAQILSSMILTVFSAFMVFFWITNAMKDEDMGEDVYGFGWTEDVDAKVKELKW